MAATCTAAWTRAPRQEQAAEIPIVLFPSVVFPGATVQLQAFEFRVKFSKDEEIGGSHSAQMLLARDTRLTRD
ncbi:hypothetical protein OsI_12419 [Oryza sativa Indica Group]|uniref:Uncharacterized protein n=1 Tax=Oryza sativa subsp. indica TaxID=39946 RepID=A2XJ06_ORYSI|nr:hypothetical protein OsI_12419 [Oryza sativa Indica Group]